MSLFNEPFDLSDQRARELLELAITGYTEKPPLKKLVSGIGIAEVDVDWDGSVADVWPRIFILCARRNRLRELVKAMLKDENYAQVRPRIAALFAAAEEERDEAKSKVVLPGCSPADIPQWLGPASATYDMVSVYRSSPDGLTPVAEAPVLSPHGTPNAASPSTVPPLVAPTAPERCDVAERGKIGAILRILAELSPSLTAMTSWPSWTPERWQRETTVLRARLVTLDGYLGELPSEYRPRADGMRQIIRLDVATAKIKGLAQDIQESLNDLQNSTSPSGVFARERGLFAARSADFRRAARQLQQLLQP
jgi:hypothetical protein